MRFPLYIAKRYLRSKSSQNAVNIINMVTFAVIVIGSAALFIVLSGFSGLKSFSVSFSNTFDPDLKALPANGKIYTFPPSTAEALNALPEIASLSAELEERVYLTHNQKSSIAYIKGVDSAYTLTTGIDSALFTGQWDLIGQQTVTGIGMANLLSLSVQDYRSPLIVLAPKPGKGGLGSGGLGEKPYNQLSLVLSGVYQLEKNLDQKYVFAELPLVQALLERDYEQVSAVNFKLAPGVDENSAREAIEKIMGPDIVLKNRRQLNQTLYRMLNTENLATYLIFTLVLIIALFNVVGAIIMMVLDKQKHSRTLYSLGLTLKDLRRIYFVQGVLVTSAGGFIGLVIGSILILSQQYFGWLMITPSLAYPVEFQLLNILLVLGTIIVLGVIAAKIASNRINYKLLKAG
ncbi:ABC transporter permease [Robiginitalea aurantiaca]|uniref:ABC transporter permease n=1 Tax=Robiginitalea aurantiaca TaxID=3056915 RepID=A0ABT7WAA0_9FLAO|nr:FtsX-like permease family protein [Robiginitalea aurantiaca]MDM9629839.1 ABC transporter permease [Robiginitalea aurantiaca]